MEIIINTKNIKYKDVFKNYYYCRNDGRMQKTIPFRKSIPIRMNQGRETFTIQKDKTRNGAIQNFSKTINIMAIRRA